MRIFYFLFFVLAFLPNAFASEYINAVKPQNSAPEVIMKFTDFNMIFRNNPNLKKEDLNVLPIELQRFLLIDSDWEEKEIWASSTVLSSRRFLVSVTSPSISGYWSKSALLERKAQIVSPSKGLGWEPLYLPKLEEWGDGWAISVSDNHPNLEWNAEMKAFQTTYCSDLASKACIRHTTRLFRDRHVLVLVEIDTSRRDENWEVFWEKGKWLPKAPKAILR